MMKHIRTKIVAGVLVAAACTFAAQGQSDALLKKLVEKKLLTQQEADDLKKETVADFDKAYRTKSMLPDWVTGVKIYGDLRGRYDLIHFENDEHPSAKFKNVDRERYRIRARVGMTASFQDNLELGVRFSTANTGDDASQGGNAVSGNADLKDNGSRKYSFFDLAYGKWSPIKNDNWTLSATVGKMENPFTFTDLVMDNDYTPEGAALQLAYKLNNVHSFKLTGGGFIVDEVNQGKAASSDPYFVGVQARWDAKWTKHWETSLGIAALGLSDTATNLGNSAVQNNNFGNTRRPGSVTHVVGTNRVTSANPKSGLLANHFSPVVGDASVTYWIDETPIYKGRFPIRAFGTLMHNPRADNENTAWELGVAFGKAGKKGTWELSYRYRHLEADSQFEEFVDDDFGAFYAGAPATTSLNRGSKGGYGAGTNVKGHTVKASYSPYDALLLSVTYFRAELIDAVPKGSVSDTGRFFVDATWKF